MNEREDIRETENGRDPREIEQDIDRTRARLGRTVERLERRLSPGELIDQVLGTAREQGGEFAINLGRSVRNNPMPVILTGVGLAWMMASSNEPRAASHDSFADYEDLSGDGGDTGRMKKGLSSAKAKAGEITGRMGEGAARAKESLHGLGDKASDARYRMRSGGERLRHGFDTLMEEQPLLIGAIGVAIGAALGAALPHTESEDRLLGDTRDSAARSLKERAADAYDQVKEKAAEVASSSGVASPATESGQDQAPADREPLIPGQQFEGTQGTAGTAGTAAGDTAWQDSRDR